MRLNFVARSTVSVETLTFLRFFFFLFIRKSLTKYFSSSNLNCVICFSAHVDNEMYLSRALDRLGAASLNKDQEPDIAAAFMKFSVVTKELSALMKTLVSYRYRFNWVRYSGDVEGGGENGNMFASKSNNLRIKARAWFRFEVHGRG